MRRFLQGHANRLYVLKSQKNGFTLLRGFRRIPFRRTYQTTAECLEQNGDTWTPTPKQQGKPTRDVLSNAKERVSRSVSTELTYLKDPLKIADRIYDLLKKDDLSTAMELVRRSSIDNQCIVSWNHIIDYELKNGHVNSAIKIYNEVCTMNQ
jgi:hypothetical protein